MKKQLSILAGSIVLASSAQAALTGGNAFVVLNQTGGGSFILDTGVAASDVAAGTGFSIDISSSTLASIDSYAVLGLFDGTGNTYNAAEYIYVSPGAGVLYAASASGGAASNNDVGQAVLNLQAYFAAADLGANAEGTGGDLDNNATNNGAFTVGYSASGVTNLFVRTQNTGNGADLTQVAITSPDGAQEGVYIDGSTFNATSLGQTVVPVPAAAWLFGSALLGLGVVRRK